MTSVDDAAQPVDGSPLRRHIMIPDGKTLCGKDLNESKKLPPDVYARKSSAEFVALVDERLNAPACGPCLLIAGNLRFQASVLRRSADDQVYPPRPQDGWRLLADSPWGNLRDIKPYLDHMDTLKMSYSASDFEVDTKLVDQRLADAIKEHQKSRANSLKWHEREAAALRDRERPDYEDL